MKTKLTKYYQINQIQILIIYNSTKYLKKNGLKQGVKLQPNVFQNNLIKLFNCTKLAPVKHLCPTSTQKLNQKLLQYSNPKPELNLLC